MTVHIGRTLLRETGKPPVLPIECVIGLKGDGAAIRVSSCTAVKRFPPAHPHKSTALHLQLEIIVAGDPSSAIVQLSQVDIWGQLQSLIADARASLRTLPVVGIWEAAKERQGPVVVLEALVYGDLSVARSGFRKPAIARFCARDVAVRVAACDGFASGILPDLVQAILSSVTGTTSPAGVFRAADAAKTFKRTVAENQLLVFK